MWWLGVNGGGVLETVEVEAYQLQRRVRALSAPRVSRLHTRP